MAQKPHLVKKLSFVEIIMGADAETIKAAYEARVKVDDLLAARDEAYRRIIEIENNIETIVGDPGVFVYPPPPCPVAGLDRADAAPRRQPKSAAKAGGDKGDEDTAGTAASGDDVADSASEGDQPEA